ncbi:hypothetical protein SOVF_051480 [Spinacia oleracea]|nr:hypothetical protein SOVF_051480 [Spinacia oleracea]
MEYMDTPEITSTGKKPLLPLSSAKKLTSKTHALPEKKSTKGTLPQIKVTTTKPEIIYADRWNFRSLVQRLTGRSAKDTDRESDQLVLKVSKKSKWYEDMYNCISSLKMLECSVNVSQECLDCLVYCSLFPKDYEIDRDTLFQLWIAEGLIKEEPMEDIASSYLKALCDRGKCISLLREYYSTGKVWYKVNSFQIPEKVLQNSKITPVRLLISDDPASVLSVTETEHFHVALQRLLPKDHHVLGRFSKIRTLLLLRNHKANNVERIPYDFFMSLQNLRALDLSRTKLRNCPRLIALPKAIRRLICLRHLDLGTLRRLNSMPTGMGALSCLRTLSEFVAGRENGCRITELGNMNDLGGKLCLSKLENVASLDDAKEANLRNKQRLKNLELRWTDDDDEHQESIGVKYEVIDYLQPNTNLQDLRILCYGGSTFPSWISNPSFVKLTKITLFKCASCQLLPSLGQLPSLESLSLIELIGVKIIDSHFRRDSDKQLIAVADNVVPFVAFPALQKLEIKLMLELENWYDVEKVDFPSLINFTIKDCPKLAALCELKNINALEYLELNQCTKLLSLPEEELPASLETLVIESCPFFSLIRSMEEKRGWVKNQHSPTLSIYQFKAAKGSKGREV